MGPVGKNDSNGTDAEEEKMASNVVCKCEKVTGTSTGWLAYHCKTLNSSHQHILHTLLELEVVRAIRRSLPIDSTQAIRKRTRAGMGHCQGKLECVGN